MKVNIKVIEILSRVVTIDALSEDDAIMNVKDMYKNEEIVLDYSDFNNVIIEKEEENFDSQKDLLINKVIQHLIGDEKRRYEESGKPTNHIYLTLLELQDKI